MPIFKLIKKYAISPSGIQHTGKVRNFPKPREATESDIENIISRFVYAATVAKNIGYSGVEIHAAHQFLICQFLSPLTNRRNDKWGGCLENRMRFLMEVVRSVRSSVGYHFPLAVKLNLSDGSNDFNGWTEEESVYVCAALEKEKVDFIELSSGSYEFAPMLGSAIVKVENRNDEAYFINYAKKVRKFAPNIPIMLTGGVRDVFAMENILKNDHAQILGLARPFIVDPNVANRIISGEIKKIPVSEEESLPVMDQLKSYQEKIRLLAEKKS
jgi:2,4-dienoyl-CoA reductase-like NADH-dependent reductase (Old Yellow Enzyme family)